jgi:hypothetical protein
MKWFKHDSDASNDAKLKKLRLKYGAQGYGIYWYCLELIARNVEKHNLTFELEHDAELIADDFKLSSDLVQHIMTYMVELELFEDIDGVISCLKMATRADEYTQQILRDSMRYKMSRECPESVPRISEVREEKRIEKIKHIHEGFDTFWSAYPNKDNKAQAKKSWDKHKPNLDLVLSALSWQKETRQWKGGFIPMAATYINNSRWEDENPGESYADIFAGAI